MIKPSRSRLILAILLLSAASLCSLASVESITVSSPDGRLVATLHTGQELTWTLHHEGSNVLAPSRLALMLDTGEILGYQARIEGRNQTLVDTHFETPLFRKSRVHDLCHELTLEFEGSYGLIFRVYDDAVAYRFFTRREGDLVVRNETVQFNFPEDHTILVPWMNDCRDGVPFVSSFEAYYSESRISEMDANGYAMLPMLVNLADGKKAVLLEVDLEDYPGMYLRLNETSRGLSGVFPRVPLKWESGGYENMNLVPTERAPEIARTRGTRDFPWRVMALSTRDTQLLDNDIVQKLASPSRIADATWIRPGKSTWDWWNDWTLRDVAFKSGQNTKTYLHHIDFAAEFGVEYITIDWGWTDIVDLTVRNPDVDLEAIVSYGKQRKVGVIVWASWQAVLNAMETCFADLARIGVAGLKIDFIDRDDQVAVASVYDIASRAAKHRLLINYHGMYKPSGLQRTWPNVINYEGVKGLENEKWADEDSPRNDVLIPFIRNLSGPMDYTPGAMHNAIQSRFRSVNDAPMSKGTRCHQVAMYVIYDAPLQMLADSPSRYRAEPECTAFMTRLPTVYDRNLPLAAEVGTHLAVAREKDGVWYLAAMTDWTPRTIPIGLDFLGEGQFTAEIMRDGVNAGREGKDFLLEKVVVTQGDTLEAQMAGGGGWVAILTPL
jgi:alpha-glucosidase